MFYFFGNNYSIGSISYGIISDQSTTLQHSAKDEMNVYAWALIRMFDLF
jgi:hypothetical protein